MINRIRPAAAAAAFAYRAASTVSFLKFPLEDPSLLPVTPTSGSNLDDSGTERISSSNSRYFDVLNPASVTEQDLASSVIAKVSSMGRDSAKEVSMVK